MWMGRTSNWNLKWSLPTVFLMSTLSFLTCPEPFLFLVYAGFSYLVSEKTMLISQASAQMSSVLCFLSWPPWSPQNHPCLCSVTMQNQLPLISQSGKSLLSCLFSSLKAMYGSTQFWAAIVPPAFVSWIHKCSFSYSTKNDRIFI